MTTIVHENANYIVEVNPEGKGNYYVRNKKTFVVESEGSLLPEMINQAEHSNAYLVNRLWEWIAKQGGAARSELEAEGVVSDLDVPLN